MTNDKFWGNLDSLDLPLSSFLFLLCHKETQIGLFPHLNKAQALYFSTFEYREVL
jgi:hypothetical protein